MRTKHDWPSLIEQWRSSGQNRKAFCKTHELPYQSFLWNIRRVEDSGTGEFRQLILKEEQAYERIDYHFADGRCVSVPIERTKGTDPVFAFALMLLISEQQRYFVYTGVVNGCEF